jgi:integrase
MATKKITIRSVDALKAGETIWDDEIKGFGARRQVNRKSGELGAVSYVLKYSAHGRQRFYTIGQHGAWTPATARDKAEKLRRLVDDGKDPAADREALAEQLTLDAFFERYISGYAEIQKKPRTVEEDKRNYRLHIGPAIGDKLLSGITSADIAKLHRSRSKHPVNANRCLALVSHLFTTAEKWGEVPKHTPNPTADIEQYPEKARERMLSADEIGRLGKALERAAIGWTEDEIKALPKTERPSRRTPEDHRAIACIKLLLLTGARLSEILSLQWDWIDKERGVARLPDSKSGAKSLPLSAPALVILDSLPRMKKNPHVLAGDGDAGHFVGIQKPWQRIRKLAKLDGLRLHDLRHAFASLAVAHNESLYLVGAVLGHRQQATTQRYAHLSADPVKAMADRNAARISGLLGTAPGGDVIDLEKARKK